MDSLEVGAVQQAMPQGIIEHGAQTSEEVQLATDRPQTNQDTHATGRGNSRNRSNASPGMSHASQGINNRNESDGREVPSAETLSGGNDTQAGNSVEATSIATAFEPLNRSLETFLTRLSRTNERSEKSRGVFKKPRCYKDKYDGCIDTWKW